MQVPHESFAEFQVLCKTNPPALFSPKINTIKASIINAAPCCRFDACLMYIEYMITFGWRQMYIDSYFNCRR